MLPALVLDRSYKASETPSSPQAYPDATVSYILHHSLKTLNSLGAGDRKIWQTAVEEYRDQCYHLATILIKNFPLDI